LLFGELRVTDVHIAGYIVCRPDKTRLKVIEAEGIPRHDIEGKAKAAENHEQLVQAKVWNHLCHHWYGIELQDREDASIPEGRT